MTWRWISWGAGVVLVVAACVVLLQQVTVRDGATKVACGSGFDVAAGRTDWRDWWALDLAALAPGETPSFARSRACPDALNRRLFLVGALVVLDVAAVAGFEASRARRRAAMRPPAKPTADRVHRLGLIVTVAGALLATAGAAALVLLVADPRSTLFLYVDRPVAVLLGLLLLQPAIAMILVGRALILAAAMPSTDGGQDGS
jgi:hypothetical protein